MVIGPFDNYDHFFGSRLHQNTISAPSARRVMYSLLSGLAEVHSMGFIHRDVVRALFRVSEALCDGADFFRNLPTY